MLISKHLWKDVFPDDGTWDDMSEFEDDELKDSLERHQAVEAEQCLENAFDKSDQAKFSP